MASAPCPETLTGRRDTALRHQDALREGQNDQQERRDALLQTDAKEKTRLEEEEEEEREEEGGEGEGAAAERRRRTNAGESTTRKMARSKSESFLDFLDGLVLGKSTASATGEDDGQMGSWCRSDVEGAKIVTPRNDSNEALSLSAGSTEGGSAASADGVGALGMNRCSSAGGIGQTRDAAASFSGEDRLHAISRNASSLVDMKKYRMQRVGQSQSQEQSREVDGQRRRSQRHQQHAAPDIELPNARGGPSGTGLPARFALDMGGSLIKMVYFDFDQQAQDEQQQGIASSVPLMGGRLHFVKWETQQLDMAMDFIEEKGLLPTSDSGDESGDSGGDDDDGELGNRRRANTTDASSASAAAAAAAAATNWTDNRSCSPMRRKKVINATGGGAHKYAQHFVDSIDLHLHKCDEMDCLVNGSNFLLKVVPDEAYTFLDNSRHFAPIANNNGDLFPYLLVSIGSGVSVIKVDGIDQWERVSGTNLGGGTFVGLGRLLTGCSSFDELLELSRLGDNTKVRRCFSPSSAHLFSSLIFLSWSSLRAPPGMRPPLKRHGGSYESILPCACANTHARACTHMHSLPGLMTELAGTDSSDAPYLSTSRAPWFVPQVDMLVGDIYGSDYSHIGLSSTTIASSFGKVIASKRHVGDDSTTGPSSDAPSRADIALSLVRMISYNIGHIAYLNAMQYGLTRILFGGYFSRGNAYTMGTISFAINFWSKGKMKAMFLRHEGFLGALGAFLKSAGVQLNAL